MDTYSFVCTICTVLASQNDHERRNQPTLLLYRGIYGTNFFTVIHSGIFGAIYPTYFKILQRKTAFRQGSETYNVATYSPPVHHKKKFYRRTLRHPIIIHIYDSVKTVTVTF